MACLSSKWNYINLKVRATLSSNDNVKLMPEWQTKYRFSCFGKWEMLMIWPWWNKCNIMLNISFSGREHYTQKLLVPNNFQSRNQHQCSVTSQSIMCGIVSHCAFKVGLTCLIQWKSLRDNKVLESGLVDWWLRWCQTEWVLFRIKIILFPCSIILLWSINASA